MPAASAKRVVAGSAGHHDPRATPGSSRWSAQTDRPRADPNRAASAPSRIAGAAGPGPPRPGRGRARRKRKNSSAGNARLRWRYGRSTRHGDVLADGRARQPHYQASNDGGGIMVVGRDRPRLATSRYPHRKTLVPHPGVNYQLRLKYQELSTDARWPDQERRGSVKLTV